MQSANNCSRINSINAVHLAKIGSFEWGKQGLQLKFIAVLDRALCYSEARTKTIKGMGRWDVIRTHHTKTGSPILTEIRDEAKLSSNYWFPQAMHVERQN